MILTKNLNLISKRVKIRQKDNYLHEWLSYKIVNSFSSGFVIPKDEGLPKQNLDEEHILNTKIKDFAELIRKANYPIFFTGAGISTSLGIPDYRSGSNTMISTGPGLWNRTQQQLKQLRSSNKKIEFSVDLVVPSLTHMAIHTLVKSQVFKHIVSQNTDGLHLRSGVKKYNLSELHGNRNLQYCLKCSKKYLRDFRTLKPQQKQFQPGQKREHNTGRLCENCKGELHDSIVYFGQSLPKQQLVRAYTQGAKSDLCVAIGSSLTVKPSSNIPTLSLKHNQNGKLVILNIQQTPLDQSATLKINGFCDNVMKRLMQQLNIPIHPYKTEKYLVIQLQRQYDKWKLSLHGIDQKHENFSFIKQVRLINKSEQTVQKSDTSKNFPLDHFPQELKNKFNFEIFIDSQYHQQNRINSENQLNFHTQSYEEILLNIKFFGFLLPSLNINLHQFVSFDHIIGKQEIYLKIISENNQQWTIQRVSE